MMLTKNDIRDAINTHIRDRADESQGMVATLSGETASCDRAAHPCAARPDSLATIPYTSSALTNSADNPPVSTVHPIGPNTNALRQLVPKVADRLKASGLILATAESCTGGGLSYWLTSLPGSSDWFDRGFVTYSNAAKIDMLGVNPTTLDTHGAVSGETAKEMAEGVLKHSGASVSISITGIAGPDGGSAEKPVGTVWIGWGKKGDATTVKHHLFTGDRQAIRLEAMVVALSVLLSLL